MKRTGISLFLLLLTSLCFSQSDSTKSWIDILSSSTISFGVDTTVDYTNSSGQIVKKRIFHLTGTGVIFYVKHYEGRDTAIMPVIITAKHVLYNPSNNYMPKKINIRFKWDEEKPLDEYFGKPINLYDGNGNSGWLGHNEVGVDLAAIPIADELGNSLFGDRKVSMLPYSMLKSLKDSYESQEIFALGFPGIGVLEYATKPIIRRGIIAWISPVTPDIIPFLIDCNLYPGNSGGPVFVNEFGIGKTGDANFAGGLNFLGIASMMQNKFSPIFSETSKAILDANGKKIFSLESLSLGRIEPAFRVRELLSQTEKIINKK